MAETVDQRLFTDGLKRYCTERAYHMVEKEKVPEILDLRHTFAYHSLAQMSRVGLYLDYSLLT